MVFIMKHLPLATGYHANLDVKHTLHATFGGSPLMDNNGVLLSSSCRQLALLASWKRGVLPIVLQSYYHTYIIMLHTIVLVSYEYSYHTTVVVDTINAATTTPCLRYNKAHVSSKIDEITKTSLTYYIHIDIYAQRIAAFTLITLQ